MISLAVKDFRGFGPSAASVDILEVATAYSF
jgi:hypothetical protein